MKTSELQVGKPYFLFAFLDSDLKFPSIDTFVYIGMNILGENSSKDDARWYFQAAESYIDSGPFNPKTQKITNQLITVAEDLLKELLTYNELIERLTQLNIGNH